MIRSIHSIMTSMLAAIVLCFCAQAWADSGSIKENLTAAREKVLLIVNGQGDAAKLKPEIAALSAKIDSEADSVPGFKPVWEQFKANRDNKIVPAFDGTAPDTKDAAKALATGEQKQLYEKMLKLLS